MAKIASYQIHKIHKIIKKGSRLYIRVSLINCPDEILLCSLKQFEKSVVDEVRNNWRVKKIERLLKKFNNNDSESQEEE